MAGKTSHRVVWARDARADLRAIVDYIARDDVDAASKVLDVIEERVSSLRAMPMRGRIIPELEEQGIGLYREVLEPPWRVMYRVSGETVWVLAVIDARRNIADILLDKLTR